MEQAKSMLTSKPVLYGGLALGALMLYLYFHNAGSTSTDAAATVGPDVNYPYSLVYGMSGNPGVASGSGNVVSSPTYSSGNGMGFGDQALVELQTKQLDLQSHSLDLNNSLSVLHENNSFAVDMANIAATRDYSKQQATTTELATLSQTFLASQKMNSNVRGLNANINGETIGVSVVTPASGRIQQF